MKPPWADRQVFQLFDPEDWSLKHANHRVAHDVYPHKGNGIPLRFCCDCDEFIIDNELVALPNSVSKKLK